ncbi:MAG: hypothetical protein JWO06_495 [Bacteroidota bacterium]|nr:hypothetical protein [Bacteroidota bacterium]
MNVERCELSKYSERRFLFCKNEWYFRAKALILKIFSFKRFALLTPLLFFVSASLFAADKRDTIKMGIFIESIYDLDFANYSYSTNFWMWSVVEGDLDGNGKSDEADSLASINRINLIEISNAKDYTYTRQSSTRVISKGRTYWWAEQFCKATVYQKWALENYPFDKQRLALKFENSSYDTTQAIMLNDLDSLSFKKDINLIGWNILKSKIFSKPVAYNTDFGDPNGNGTSVYSRVAYVIQLKRIDAVGFFLKLCLGVFIAFLVAIIVFGINPSNMDSRFGLGIGALFAVAANKYVVDSNIPQSATNCLVDKVHEITFIYILAILFCTVISLRLHESSKHPERVRFDLVAGLSLLISYAAILVYYLTKANQDVPW